MAIRPARFMAMSVPPRPSTRLRSTNLTMPLLRASRVERSETRVAVPPMWNVRNVHEAAREVAGVGGFERRIGQAFARAVRRDEVLQHGEAFAEAGRDGRLDDFAGGLGHQAAHPGKLADLLFRTTRAAVSHDVD